MDSMQSMDSILFYFWSLCILYEVHGVHVLILGFHVSHGLHKDCLGDWEVHQSMPIGPNRGGLINLPHPRHVPTTTTVITAPSTHPTMSPLSLPSTQHATSPLSLLSTWHAMSPPSLLSTRHAMSPPSPPSKRMPHDIANTEAIGVKGKRAERRGGREQGGKWRCKSRGTTTISSLSLRVLNDGEGEEAPLEPPHSVPCPARTRSVKNRAAWSLLPPHFSSLTPPVLGGIVPVALMLGRCWIHMPPPSFPFHTPQQGGFSTSNKGDNGVVYNPHAAPCLTSFPLDYVHSGVIERGWCATHTLPPFLFIYPPIGGILVFVRWYCWWGAVYDPPIPLSLHFPPFIGGDFFFYASFIEKGPVYNPPVFFTPQTLGGFSFASKYIK